MNEIPLDFAVLQILDDVMETLRDEQLSETGKLIDVKEFILGETYDGKPDTPCVFIVTGEITPLASVRAIGEDWSMPIAFLCWTEQDGIEQTYKGSLSLASRVRTAILKSKKFDRHSWIIKVGSGKLTPTGDWNQNSTISGSSAVINVEFSTLEY